MTTPEQETPDQELSEQETFDQETPDQETPEAIRRYYISFDRLTELERSAVAMLAGRRMPSCPSWNKPHHELTDVVALVDEVAKYCADEEGFIQTEMPIQEIVFRMLLARHNEPTPLGDLHYELTERWATPVRPISVTEDGLGRILNADTYYGFAHVSVNAEG